jgi:hypothetical protein
MSKRFIVIVILICTACHGGLIPCPKPKTAKLQKSFKPSPSLLTAKANQPETEAQKKDVKLNDVRYIQNVSMEEWDCPKPGSKHYMPKSIKENIKRNKKKIEADYKKQKADSLRMAN